MGLSVKVLLTRALAVGSGANTNRGGEVASHYALPR